MHLFPDHTMLGALERHFGTPTPPTPAVEEKQLSQLDTMNKPKVILTTLHS